VFHRHYRCFAQSPSIPTTPHLLSRERVAGAGCEGFGSVGWMEGWEGAWRAGVFGLGALLMPCSISNLDDVITFAS
jgi:hypothetical protein